MFSSLQLGLADGVARRLKKDSSVGKEDESPDRRRDIAGRRGNGFHTGARIGWNTRFDTGLLLPLKGEERSL